MTSQDHMDEKLEREINDILGKQRGGPTRPQSPKSDVKPRRSRQHKQNSLATQVAVALALFFFTVFLIRLGPYAALRLIPVLALIALGGYLAVRFGRNLWK